MKNLRSDQWMMLGVVLLGGIAVYYLARPKRGPSDMETPILKGPDGPPPVLPAFLQDRPRGERAKRGQWFRGRLDLGPTADPIPASATREQIAAYLRSLGFERVQVYMTAAEAAPDVQLGPPLAGPSAGTRWFTGRWNGAVGTNLVRPARMTYLWFVAEPTATGRQRAFSRIHPTS